MVNYPMVSVCACHGPTTAAMTEINLLPRVLISWCAAGVVAVDCCGDLPKARRWGIRGVDATGVASVN